MAKDLQYTVGVDVQDARNGLKRLKTDVETVNDTFARMKQAIAGVAIGSFITNIYGMSAAIADMSAASGLSIQTISGLTKALINNGSTVDRARDGISDFTKNLGEARRGSTELQKAFAEAGVSLKDLGTLSSQDILRKTISGLGQVNDNATRAAVGMKIFGESTKGVDLQGVNNQLDGFIARSAATEDAIAAAAGVSRNFNTAFYDFKIAVLEALQPISELALQVTNNRENIQMWIEKIIDVTKALAGLFILSKILKVISSVSLAIAYFRRENVALAGSLGLARDGLKDITKTWRSFGTQLRAIRRQGAITGTTFLALTKRVGFLARGLLRFIPILGQLYLGWELVTGIINTVFGIDIEGWLGKQADKIKEFFGYVKQAKEEIKDEVPTATTTPTEQSTTTIENPLTKELQAQLATYRDQNSELVKSLQFKKTLVGLTSQESEYQSTINAFTTTRDKLLAELTKKENALTAIKAKNTAEEENQSAALKLIREQKEQINKAYNETLPLVQAAAQATRDAALAEEAKTKQLELQAKLRGLQNNQLSFEQSVSDRISKATNELDMLNMDPLQQQLRSIAQEVDQNFTSRIRNLQEQLRDTTISPAERAQLIKDLKWAQDNQEKTKRTLQDITKQTYDTQRTFTYGWRKAWQEYAENANNAANKAGEMFNKVTKGMEDAIVNFAKTGKFEFKTFLADILETMLRSNIQRVIAEVFTPPQLQAPRLPSGGGGQGGGFLDGLTGILGGIGDFFGGFFANGGSLPAGKFGIVGERGPELITGPANITPMAMGGNVTYNINAVDAASFKSLVARDPEFIHAVATYGGRNIPGRR